MQCNSSNDSKCLVIHCDITQTFASACLPSNALTVGQIIGGLKNSNVCRVLYFAMLHFGKCQFRDWLESQRIWNIGVARIKNCGWPKMDEWSEWPIKHVWLYLYGFKNQWIMYLKCLYEESLLYCTVYTAVVYVYVHIKKLSLRAAVVANRSITASMHLLMTVWLTDYMCTLCMAHCFLFLLAWFLILCLYDLILCGCRYLFRPSCVFFYIFLNIFKIIFLLLFVFFVLTVFFVLFYGGQFNGLLWLFW